MLDIAILGDPTKSVPALAINNEANDGVYKLVQRVMILLLTDINDPFQLGLGTELPTQITSSNILDAGLLQALVSQALSRVRVQLLQDQLDDTPPDEALDRLQAIVPDPITRDTEFVDVIVSTLAGDSVTVSLPITDIFNQETD